MIQSALSRVGFCPNCFKRGSLRFGDRFLVTGSTSGKTHLMKVQKSTIKNKGFVPHWYMLEKIEDGIADVLTACCVVGCGISLHAIHRDKEGTQFDVEITRVDRIQMSLADWEALKTFTDTGYKL